MSDIAKMLEELCPNGVEYKPLGELWEKAPKSKLGVAQVKAFNGGGGIICFTSGSQIFYIPHHLVDGEYIFMNDGGNADIKYNNGKSYYTDHIFAYTIKNKKELSVKFLY